MAGKMTGLVGSFDAGGSGNVAMTVGETGVGTGTT